MLLLGLVTHVYNRQIAWTDGDALGPVTLELLTLEPSISGRVVAGPDGHPRQVHLVNDDPARSRLISYHLKLPQGADGFSFTGRLTLSDLASGMRLDEDARIFAIWLDAAGQRLPRWPSIIAKSHSDVEDMEIDTVTGRPVGAASALLRIRLHRSTGTLLLRDITIAPARQLHGDIMDYIFGGLWAVLLAALLFKAPAAVRWTTLALLPLSALAFRFHVDDILRLYLESGFDLASRLGPEAAHFYLWRVIDNTDSLLHVGLFLVITLATCWRPAPHRFGLAIRLVNLAAFAYATETIQLMIPGRTLSALDWIADMIGVAAGLMLISLIRRDGRGKMARTGI